MDEALFGNGNEESKESMNELERCMIQSTHLRFDDLRSIKTRSNQNQNLPNHRVKDNERRVYLESYQLDACLCLS